VNMLLSVLLVSQLLGVVFPLESAPSLQINEGEAAVVDNNVGLLEGEGAVVDNDVGLLEAEAAVVDNDVGLLGIWSFLGGYADPYEYPFMVQIFDNKTGKSRCGGALVGRRIVFTATHCLEDNEGPLKSNDVTFVFREHHAKTRHLDRDVRVKGWRATWFAQDARALTHPDFAIVLLNQDVVTKDGSIRPVRFYDGINPPGFVKSGDILRTIGFGVLENSHGAATPEYLKEVDVKVTINPRRNFPPEENKYWIVTEGAVLNGDSGGPLLKFYNGEWILVGTLSGTWYGGNGDIKDHSDFWNDISFYAGIAARFGIKPQAGIKYPTPDCVIISENTNGKGELFACPANFKRLASATGICYGFYDPRNFVFKSGVKWPNNKQKFVQSVNGTVNGAARSWLRAGVRTFFTDGAPIDLCLGFGHERKDASKFQYKFNGDPRLLTDSLEDNDEATSPVIIGLSSVLAATIFALLCALALLFKLKKAAYGSSQDEKNLTHTTYNTTINREVL